MKCVITGRTGSHVPFNVIDYAKYHGGESEIFDWIYPTNKYYEKMIGIINDINIYMEKEYKRVDDDIIVLYGEETKQKEKSHYNTGVIYIFSDTDSRRIRGEIFIIPVWYNKINILHFFYIFRTIINTPFKICPVSRESLNFYNEFCKELEDDIRELGLMRIDKLYKYGWPSIYKYDPTGSCLHPIIFKYIENIDLQSFDDFMTRVETVADKYSLQTIGRRCRDFGKPI